MNTGLRAMVAVCECGSKVGVGEGLSVIPEQVQWKDENI